MNLSGLIVQQQLLKDDDVVAATRAAYLGAGYTEDPKGALQVRVGCFVKGHAMLTDSSIVSFDARVAEDIALRLNTAAALFAVRDHGYRKGRRDERGAFQSLSTWKKEPKAKTATKVWEFVAGLGGESPFASTLWPAAWDVETRLGTALAFAAPKAPPSLFPPRDDAERRHDAQRHRLRDLMLNLRPEHHEQAPGDGPCQTLKRWVPVPLPARAEAVLAVVVDKDIRAEAWPGLAHCVWSNDLVLDERTAGLLLQVAGHRRGSDIETAVLWLCSLVLGQSVAVPSSAAVFAAAVVAVHQGLLPLLQPQVDLLGLARPLLDDPDAYRASHAALLLAVLGDERVQARVAQRAAREGRFAEVVGVHDALFLAVFGRLDAALLLWDAVQPHARSERDDATAWIHASILWACHEHLQRSRSEFDRASINRRLSLATQLAPQHAPTWNNAIVLCEALDDKEGARRAAEGLRAVDRRHPVLQRFPPVKSQRKAPKKSI